MALTENTIGRRKEKDYFLSSFGINTAEPKVEDVLRGLQSQIDTDGFYTSFNVPGADREADDLYPDVPDVVIGIVRVVLLPLAVVVATLRWHSL